jgi:hypothetical protein
MHISGSNPSWSTGKSRLGASVNPAQKIIRRYRGDVTKAAVDPDIVWAKLAALSEGARLASPRFWP